MQQKKSDTKNSPLGNNVQVPNSEVTRLLKQVIFFIVIKICVGTMPPPKLELKTRDWGTTPQVLNSDFFLLRRWLAYGI